MTYSRSAISLLWPRSIAVRTVLVVLVIAVLAGGGFIRYSSGVIEERTERRAMQRLGELLDTVESTASIACFAQDNTLAAELAGGLLKNSEIRGVTIRAMDGELVSRFRDDRQRVTDQRLRQTRNIVSPFNPGEKVGVVTLEPDLEKIRDLVQDEIRFSTTLLGIQLGLMAAVTALVVLVYVLRPIKSMSDGLHRMDARVGERLDTPPGHRHTEIGRLVGDINDLAGNLVAALDEERELRQQREIDERKYHTIFTNVETAIFLLDEDGFVSSANPACSRLLGMAEGEQDGTVALADLAWREPGHLIDLFARCRASGTPTVEDVEVDDGSGGWRWVSVLLSPVDEQTVQGVANDVTERKAAEAQARQLALIDAVTGAWNSLGLEEHLARLIAETPDEGLTLLYLEIEGYNRAKSTFGGDGMEQLAKNVYARLQGAVKVTDIVARLGSGLFAVVLLRVDRDKDALAIAERIVATLGKTFEVGGVPVQMGVNIGVVCAPEPQLGPAKPMEHAELALEQASRVGGGHIQLFSSAMKERAETRRRLETDMRLAIEREQFSLFYQPIVDLEHNRLVGAEALIRWHHHEHGMVVPDAFIPLAEETGFICDIGLWALESACKQLAEWRAAGLDLYLSLNVSGRQIPEGLPPAVLKSAAARHGIEPERLVLEITEGVLLVDMEKALWWLNSVRETGFRIYLDDFGTGYSSLSYLKRLPVDTVKVDRSFVRDIGQDDNDRALVEAVVAMARSLGLKVVAEGVENETQLAILRQMHCRSGQGYLFSRPIPSSEFTAIIGRINDQLAASGGAGNAAG